MTAAALVVVVCSESPAVPSLVVVEPSVVVVEPVVVDMAGLLAPDMSFFSIREDGKLVAIGALKQLDRFHAEVKSMHTASAARRRGAGRVMLDHLSRLSLETGSMEAFAPARALYASAGFVVCQPFAGYRPSPNSVCMTLELDPEAG